MNGGMVTEKITKKVSLGDVAKELNVSKSTVSRVLSGKGRIGEETKQRVLECIERLNYRPNAIAKSLAQSKTFNIGVVFPADKELSQIPFFQSCLIGVCEVTSALDYDVVVATATANDISQLVRLIHNNKVDGVVLTRSIVDDPAVAFLKSENMPFVLIGSSTDSAVVQIDTDHEAACAELTEHLLRNGCKKPALLIGSRKHIVNKSRYQGFKSAMHKKYTDAYSEIVFDDMSSGDVIERAVIDLLGLDCDTIICGDDYICSRVIKVIDERGLISKSGIKIASFYNNQYLKNHIPPISAIDVDASELGIAAGNSIVNLIKGELVPRKMLLGYTLSTRKMHSVNNVY